MIPLSPPTLPPDAFGVDYGYVTAERTYYYPCLACLQDGTVTATGACRGHKGAPLHPIVATCPTCGK